MERVVCKGVETSKGIKFKLREDSKIVFKEIPFNNYFYVLEDDFEVVSFTINNFILKTEHVIDGLNIRYVKIIINDNYKRGIIKKKIEELNIKTFESDINSVKRFLIDNQNIQLNQHGLKYVFMDIETFDLTPLEKDFKQNVVANEPILSFALKDLEGNIIFKQNTAIEKFSKQLIDSYIEHPKDLKIISEIRKILVDNEVDLLKSYIEIIQQYDVVFAWNGNRFDFPYIKQRMDIHRLLYDNIFVNDLDYMEIFKKNSWDSLKSFSLNNVAKHVFKEDIENNTRKNGIEEVTKIDWQEKTKLKKFFDLYLFRNEMFKEYNIQDVNLMYMMEEKLKFIKIQEIVSKLSHCLINNTVWNSHSCDYLLLNKYKQKGIIKNSKPNNEEIEIRKHPIHGSFPSGGFTRCFLPGLHEHVDAFDFKSMYPTHIITFNISPETFIENILPDFKLCFTEEEIKYINKIDALSTEFIDKKGELKLSKYLDEVEKIRKQINTNLCTMKELEWRFVKEYKNENLLKYCKENNYIFTPADINFDTRGWKIHPHRLFKQTKGVLAEISQFLLNERDKVKYQLKNIEYHSDEWWSKELYQLAIKTVGNSLFGYTSFKNSREFSYDIPDCITSVSRATIKRAIAFARDKGFESTLCDSVTKESIIIVDGKKTTIEDFWNNINVNVEKKYTKELKNIIEKNYLTLALKITHKGGNRGYIVKRNIKKIIRHKTKKQIYKITTESGKEVFVTEDHSLIINREKKILNLKTKNVKIGDYTYVNVENTGFCKHFTAWNKGMKPKQWMSKEKYKNWVKNKNKLPLNNKICGHRTPKTKTEKIAFSILSQSGFLY